MMFSFKAITSFALLLTALPGLLADIEAEYDEGHAEPYLVRKARRSSSSSASSSSSGKMSNSKSSSSSSTTTLEIRITNIAPFNPFSPFFVMVHNDRPTPLFQFGAPASAALKVLAEDGNPGPLATFYSPMSGVRSAVAGTAFTGPGASIVIPVEVSKSHPYVTLASMFVNSNDGFIAINGRKLEDGDAFFLNGYDAGTELNNELCSHIPGPSCPAMSGNMGTATGEGFVHVNAGLQRIGDLHDASVADLAGSGIPDWRNPMAYVVVTKA